VSDYDKLVIFIISKIYHLGALAIQLSHQFSSGFVSAFIFVIAVACRSKYILKTYC